MKKNAVMCSKCINILAGDKSVKVRETTGRHKVECVCCGCHRYGAEVEIETKLFGRKEAAK